MKLSMTCVKYQNYTKVTPGILRILSTIGCQLLGQFTQQIYSANLLREFKWPV